MNIPYGPILIVEDTPNVLELLDVTLRFKGYPVMTAANGKEALEKIDRERPALVITDILMPKMDGFSLAHTLRKDPRTLAIPIIFISATYVSSEDKAFAMRLGAVRFIEKPVDTEDFLLSVAEVLTQNSPTMPRPIDEKAFYNGYRERLEAKLEYKNTQIGRIERLLNSLQADQQPAFQSLLNSAINDRAEIQRELDSLLELLSNNGSYV
jgi:CheY-like chemotaxis protein